MDSNELLKTRIKKIGGGGTTGNCVLYVMSRDQRVLDNHALLAAQKHALAKKLPLAVVFCLLPKTGIRAREHYGFMLKGLREVEASLATLNIPFMMLIGSAYERLGGVFYHVKPDAVYFDFNPLRGPQKLQKALANDANFPCYVVDAHNVVPIWVASQKMEVGARTLRPKIHRLLATYLVEPERPQMHPYAWVGPVIELALLDAHVKEVLKALRSNGTKSMFESGETAARKAFERFKNSGLKTYAEDRNNPTKDGLSNLSPYLHFGQISSLRVALEASNETLIEEMIIRKELSDNWCYYNENYDKLEGGPQWAQNSLAKHASDTREFLYTIEEFAAAKTHDPAWNAAQKQLTATGKMHGYMRMYWAKKVLEWSASPRQAIEILIYLNDFYSLDGGDPNGYTGIMWSVVGVHDRPWGERPVYGVIRCMVYTGLKRKFDVAAYEEAWNV